MAEERVEETVAEEPQEKVEIRYVFARFHRRVLANLIDFILWALLFLGFFLGIRAIVTHTPPYLENENELIAMRLDSGLYRKTTENKVFDIVSYLNLEENAFSGYAKQLQAVEAIDAFIVYTQDSVGQESADTIQKNFDEYRLDPNLNYLGKPYFISVDGEIKKNEDCSANALTYFEKVYAPYIDDRCQGYLVTMFPRYLELVRFESNCLFFAELLPAYVVSPILVYYVPTLFFKRGRMTIGKWMYRIGIIDKNLLIPSFKRSSARFLIFYFAELMLSPFTFAIPLIVSASLMAFSRSHQGFPDFLLGIYEVDADSNKLYFTQEEILLSDLGAKKPIEFHPTYED